MNSVIYLGGRPLRYDRVISPEGTWGLRIRPDGSTTLSAPKAASKAEIEAYLHNQEQAILAALLRFSKAEEHLSTPVFLGQFSSAAPDRSSDGPWWILYTLLVLMLLGGMTLGFHQLQQRLLSLPAGTPEPVAAAAPSVSPSAAPRPSPSPVPPHPTPSATPPPPEEQAGDPADPDSSFSSDNSISEAVLWPGGYLLRVNVQCNTVTVYSSDENGVYSQPVRAMVCSTGAATPGSGLYTPGWRQVWQTLFGQVYGQYVTQITGNILFHSVPYTVYGDKGSLEYWEFDKLGTSCSAGCVRLQVADAQWIYDNRDSIAGIEFYSSSDPGPLGKPSAPTISGDTRCRGWDPTDPDPANPWRNKPKPTPSPSPSPSPAPEPSPEPSPAATPEPSPEPTDEIVPEPTPEPSPEPTKEPVLEPDVSEPDPKNETQTDD